MLIGYMHYRKKPMELNRAYAFAAVAKAEGAELLFFSPGAIDFQKRKISGYIYNNGEWVDTVSEYPDVVCNVVGFSRDKQVEAIERLQKEVPFTSYSIGSKMTVYNNLVDYKKFSSYLVPSDKVLSVKHFLMLLDKYTEIVFKPSSGCQGLDVYYIKRENETFKILSSNEEISYDANEISNFILNKIEQEEYIVQPYINSRTKSGDSYDFRLHVQKNSAGEWVVSKIYPRISPNGSIVCNISQGGYTYELISFLKREFGDNYYNIKKYLEIFSLQLAEHMDEIQKELYGEELSELGIDVGLDNSQRVYIYEINWRPGHPPCDNIDLSIIKNSIHYAILLAKRKIYLL